MATQIRNYMVSQCYIKFTPKIQSNGLNAWKGVSISFVFLSKEKLNRFVFIYRQKLIEIRIQIVQYLRLIHDNKFSLFTIYKTK